MFPPITTLINDAAFAPMFVPMPQIAAIPQQPVFAPNQQQIIAQPVQPIAPQTIEQPVQVGPAQKIKCKFTQQEDFQLNQLVSRYGKNWNLISKIMITRNPRQCRERWNNYLNPQLSNSPWTYEEDLLLAQIYAKCGPHWSKISKHFPTRSDNSVRNRWHALLKRSEKRMASSTASTSSSDDN